VRNRTISAALLATAVAVTALVPHGAGADSPPLRVGWIATFSGGYTTGAKVADAAVAAFHERARRFDRGRKLEIINATTAASRPIRRSGLAQELIISDKVDFSWASRIQPNAMAIDRSRRAVKKPLLITNGAANGLLGPNPYFSRFSYTEGQLTHSLAQWALKNNIKTAYMAYLDFATGSMRPTVFKQPTRPAAARFSARFASRSTRPDFSAYVQRIKDAKPQAVFVFLTFPAVVSSRRGSAPAVRIGD